MKRAALLFAVWSLALTGPPRAAVAAVVQPDGQVMPKDANNDEVTLQQLFDFKEGSGVIDAVADAATEPATFKPLCDFSAQLLLHETSSDAGVGWYNSPQDGTTPTAVCDETTDLSSAGVPCTASDIFLLVPGDVAKPPFSGDGDPLTNPGDVFSGAELAKSKYYLGGDIGFVLLTPQKHYSERRLNPACVGEKCISPGNWIPTIMYASKAVPRGFYMCSEDQDIPDTEWGGNDGDFQDFVFLFTGLVCSGSGEPCDTGKDGICAAGLTDCANAAGESECRPARAPTQETCNGLNDDCDDETDEGELCPPGELCVKSRCVPVCGTGEFRCDEGYQCVQGACVEKACVSVECDAGLVCIGGECVGACDAVACPTGQACVDGVCTDPCAGIDCGEGFVCEGGACRVECGCAGCEAGECDPDTGRCVDSGCAGVVCDDGEHCEAGACVSDCEGAQCPGGAACEAGLCLPPANGADGANGANGAGGADSGMTPDLSFGGESVTTPGNDEGGMDAGGTNAVRGNVVEVESGCACRTAGGSGSGAAGSLLALLGAWSLAKRRRAHSQ
jgi:MYXO-CTERM domain-containing protein